jgi:DNA (cytosine-5)-methyltransferase 1
MEGATPVPPDFFTERGVPQECIVRGEGEPTGVVHPYLTRQLEQGDFSFGKRSSPTHCEIVDLRKPSKTIICTYDHQPRLYVALQTPSGNFLRPYTVKELQQIQGFPKNYSVEGSLKDKIVQIGNAVPPPLITQVCKALTT